MKKTARGFAIYSEIKDTYGNKIVIQESSAACHHCVWIFTTNSNGTDCVFDPATNTHISATPHLNKVQARRVAKALLKFADS